MTDHCRLDEEFEDNLVSLGVDANEAKIITYLRNVKEASAQDLIKFSLDKGAISILMRGLVLRGWIVFRIETTKQSRGKPFRVFKTNIEAIIHDIERLKKREARITLDLIKRLKELSREATE